MSEQGSWCVVRHAPSSVRIGASASLSINNLFSALQFLIACCLEDAMHEIMDELTAVVDLYDGWLLAL
jgi:hypothetical protein